MNKTKLETWYEMSVLLKQTKTREAELRRELCEAFIGETEMVKGRVTVKGDERHLAWKAVQALSFSIDAASLHAMWSELSEVEKECIKHTPGLNLTAYKKLPEDSLLHEAVISKLAMPTLTAEIKDGAH